MTTFHAALLFQKTISDTAFDMYAQQLSQKTKTNPSHRQTRIGHTGWNLERGKGRIHSISMKTTFYSCRSFVSQNKVELDKIVMLRKFRAAEKVDTSAHLHFGCQELNISSALHATTCLLK